MRASATGALALLPGQGARAAGLGMRPDIATPAGQKMIALYAKAVMAMQDPALNYPPRPNSWIFQSYIHAVPKNPFDPANSGGLYNGTQALVQRIDEIYGSPAAGTPQAHWKAAALKCWGTCTHASAWFTVWHRWYMYYFEVICRSMCGSPDFMLPYWNYASDIGPSLQLPPAFQPNPDGSPNVLLFDDRGLGFDNPQGTGSQNVAMNAGGYMPYPLIDYGPALGAKPMFPSDTTYVDPTSPDYAKLGFTGRLECVPHDMVHDNVGGWMGNVPSAAGDPIFYMHHCQIDRLFATWSAQPGISYNFRSVDAPTDPTEKTWTERVAYFVNEKGTLVEVKSGTAVSTEKLGYGYDTLAKPPAAKPALTAAAAVPAAPPVVVAAMQSSGFKVGSAGGSVTLTPTAPAAPAPRASGAAPQASAPAPTILTLEGLKLVRRPPAPLSVFINLPAGTAPQLGSPYYVGSINLFNFDVSTGAAMGDHGMAMPMAAPAVNLSYDVTEVLARQKAAGLWTGPDVTVTVTTLGADTSKGQTYVAFEHVTLRP